MLPIDKFMIDLLKENIVRDYKAKREDVRVFYSRSYRKKTGCLFEDFTRELWYYWYIRRRTAEYFHFDKRWVDYFKKLESAQHPKESKFQESRYVTENKCLLCKANFKDQGSYKTHIESQAHKIRLQYVQDKKSFTHTEDLCLEIIEINNNNDIKSSSALEIKPKTNVNVTLHIKNTSTSEVKLVDLIQVNPLITDITLHDKFEKGSILKPTTKAVIVLNGYFENSASFNFPLVIVTEKKETKEFVLKEILIEVTSEFSHLKGDSNLTWKRVKNVPILEIAESVVPGKRPDLYSSYYKETLPLSPFKISQFYELKLTDLIRAYPSFIQRGLPIADRFFNSTYSSILQINSRINKDNYCQNYRKLLDIEENQLKVDIRDYDMISTLNVVKGSSLFQLEVPGLAEARPSLLVYDSVYIKLNKDDKYKFQGIVHKILETSVYLGVNHRFSESHIKNKKYHIEFGYNRRPIRVEKQAVHLADEHQIIPYFYPGKQDTRDINTDKNVTFFNRDLNQEQKRAVRNILIPKSVPYVIFGPPGTGKTVTVVESVLQIWKNDPGARVLICAPSNAAADEVAIRLVDTIPHMDIFRLLGTIYGSHEEKRMQKIRPITNVGEDGVFYMPSMETLLKYRVLLTTIVTAAKLVNGGVPEGHFSYVFIDESGYVTETQTLIPIAGILSNAGTKGKIQGKIVLAGDPRQLGALVHSNFVKHCGYGKSMIERLLDTCEIYSKEGTQSYDARYVTKLVKNYRSHKTILEIPNRLFYDNELIPAGDHFTKFFIGWEHLKNKEFPIIFHHVEGTDSREKDSPSFFNIQEIEEVVGYLSKLIGSRVNGMQITTEHIGVITPYRKQAEKMRAACAIKQWKSLLVGSVEQFQGKEKLIIIISTVRSKNSHKFEEIDKTCQLGFLKNPKRFNVALTRARALLIVIGNANVLKADSNWSNFIRYSVDNKSLAGKRFNLNDDEE